jgi:UDP-N-acetylglucosamine 1-carboxyvinyltransferase
MALVKGPTRLQGTEMTVPDIRSGAALVIAALCADGESVLNNAWHVDRGYPDLVTRMKDLGADIQRESLHSADQTDSGSYE